MRKIFLLIPSDRPVGPVKGAYALANSLTDWTEVTLVSLKKGPGALVPLDPRVNHLCLADGEKSMIGRLRCYQSLLLSAGGRRQTASISMCFSADAVNALCCRQAAICASVRGNLMTNYRLDYGFPGILLAATHLFSLRCFDQVVAMTESMARQIRRFTGVAPAVIGNFVDESALSEFRQPACQQGPLRFVFAGSLSRRKQPWLILEAISDLRARGIETSLELIGSGPLRSSLEEAIVRLDLRSAVRMHGFVPSPYPLIAQADAMVLPSLSEGVSRAALEALYLGTPCVLRDADGSGELISDGWNGALFQDNGQLAEAMLRAASLSRTHTERIRPSLLPQTFSQAMAAARYARLMEQLP